MKLNRKFIALSLLIAANAANAQTTTTDRFEFGYAERAAFSIPKEFSYNEIPHLVMYDSNDRNKVTIFDADLNQVKSVGLADNKEFTYELEYSKQTREVTAVTEAGSNEFSRYNSYEEFINQNSMLDPSFSESMLTITTLENGDRKITANYDNSYYSNNQQMYFAYYIYGTTYPRVYFIHEAESGNVVGYRTNYVVSYSDWKDAGTYTETKTIKLDRVRLCNININEGDGRASTYFEVSQTLFNADENFEYILPKYKLSANGNTLSDNSTSNPVTDDYIETTSSKLISTETELTLIGFQVVSENGTIISDMTFTDGFEGSMNLDHAFVITIGDNTYLAFDGYNSDNKNSTIFYKVDRLTNSIEKVKTASSSMMMLVSPTIVNRGSTMNISFSDNNENGSSIVVSSANGANVDKIEVPAGKKSTLLNTNMSSGLYTVTRLQKGQKTETKKIIVK